MPNLIDKKKPRQMPGLFFVSLLRGGAQGCVVAGVCFYAYKDSQ
jgi:hypothetical protein